MTDQEINEAVARKLGWEKTVYDYCHSIEAAWEIVESWKGDIVIERYGNIWQVWAPAQLLSTADTVPMAICLVFLKLD